MPRNRCQAGAVNVNSGAETVLATFPAISSPAGNSIDMDCNVYITAGANAGTLTLKIERGAVAGGPLVGSFVLDDFLANGHITASIQATDTPQADVAGQVYVITGTQASGVAVTATQVTGQQLF